MTTPTPSVPPPADTPAPSVEAAQAAEEHYSHIWCTDLAAVKKLAAIIDRHFAPLRQQLADVTKERDQLRSNLDTTQTNYILVAAALKPEGGNAGIETLVPLANNLRTQLAQSERELAEEKAKLFKAGEDYYRIADAACRSSEGVDDLIRQIRETRAELATAQQAQRDTATRAGMAEELAGMLTEYREALYGGPENLTGLTNDRLETESAALLARYAALPKGRL